MTLQGLRQSVDTLDGELLRLMSSRLEHTVRARRFKDTIVDTSREEQLIQRIRGMSHNFLSPDFVEQIMRLIISESRKIQDENPKLAAFHGDHGSYCEVALIKHNPHALRIPCRECSDVIQAVDNGSVDMGLIPVGNSIDGLFDQTLDLLAETNLQIVSEARVPMQHCFLTLKGSDYREIKDVISHPEVLAHCRGFIQRNKLDGIPYYDSAGAAAMLVRDRLKGTAVIASELCAAIYDLDILKADIADHPDNSTRYFMVSKEANPVEIGKKCTLIFNVSNKAGSLLEALKIFSDEGINLAKIDSRPNRKSPNDVSFLLDFEAEQKSEKTQETLAKFTKSVEQVKILGWY